MDTYQLNRELDKVKAAIFIGKNSAFLGSLMCSLNFHWDTSVPTATTDMINLWWNPDWFLSLEPKTRETILLHELWHVAKLHGLRLIDRDKENWNYACDIRINNDLENEGYSFKGVENCWKDHGVDYGGIKCEEEIYELLQQNKLPKPDNGSWDKGDGDMVQLNQEQKQQVINAVVQAVQQAKIAGQAGSLPGDIEENINIFLDPVIPWQVELMDFFTAFDEPDYSWKKRNRRFPNIYMPSLVPDENGLEDLVYFMDVSGSVTLDQANTFNSELKYIWEQIRPKKLTVVQFDTRIQDIRVFSQEDESGFEHIKIYGRGGTSLECVAQYIEKHKPTAAIIFSDLDCAPMRKVDVPIIWVVVNNPKINPDFGRVIHI